MTPKLRKTYGARIDSFPYEFLADRLLEKYPQYWKLISPAGHRLRRLAEAPIHTGDGIFDSWETFYRNEGQNIQNRRELIRTVAEAEILSEASSRGLTIPMLENEH